MIKWLKKKSLFKRILWIALFVIGSFFLFLLGTNLYVWIRSDKYIVSEIRELDRPVDAIIVLGAGLTTDNEPSQFLKDRLNAAIRLYNLGISKRLLMSGDHGDDYHNEVRVMKEYAITQGVPPDHIFMDHAGFTTYDTMIRARDIFQVKTCVIVTQKYHLFRSVYIANGIGLQAQGYASDIHISDKFDFVIFEAREFLARIKAVWMVMTEPEPAYRGEVIPITGSGAQTDDEESD